MSYFYSEPPLDPPEFSLSDEDLEGYCASCREPIADWERHFHVENELYCEECVRALPFCLACEKRMLPETAITRHWIDPDLSTEQTDVFHPDCWPQYCAENELIEKEIA